MVAEAEEVAEQQVAAMQAAQSKAKVKQEPSPLASIEIGTFFRKIVGVLTRCVTKWYKKKFKRLEKYLQIYFLY